MATVISIAPPVAQSAEPSLYRLTVDQYEHMANVGILRCGDPIELIEGLLIHKMTQNPPHTTVLELLGDLLRSRLPEGWRLREQKPIRLTDSVPEPDLVVVPGPATRYAKQHPLPIDIAIVIEVSDVTLRYDQETKKRIYARARLPIYWIINIPESKVEVYSQPRAGKSPTYRHCQIYGRNEAVPFVIAGQELGPVPVRDLLPTALSGGSR
jgi:hypothetical protein